MKVTSLDHVDLWDSFYSQMMVFVCKAGLTTRIDSNGWEVADKLQRKTVPAVGCACPLLCRRRCINYRCRADGSQLSLRNAVKGALDAGVRRTGVPGARPPDDTLRVRMTLPDGMRILRTVSSPRNSLDSTVAVPPALY